MGLLEERILNRKNQALHGVIHLAQPMSWQLITIALSGMLVLAGAFLATASYSRTESATGSVMPEGGILQIVPPRLGRVEAVMVVEGQHVRSGAPLARIRVEEVDRAGTGAQAAILTAIERQDRSLRQREELSQVASRWEGAEYAAHIESLRSELQNIESQIAVQHRLVAMAQAELARTTDIAGRGFLSRRDIASREETVLSRQQQLASLQQARAAKMGSLQQGMRARQQALARSSGAAAALTTDRAQLERERASARAEQGYTLVAPAAGRVAALSIHPGDAVAPQSTAMMIVPADNRLVARLYVPGSAMGFVRVGQTVRLAFDAYPYERFGTLQGTIVSLSTAPVLRPETGGATTPFYIATATIPDASIFAHGRGQTLVPGMTFRARIVTERRSLIEWIVAPLQGAARQ